MYKIQQVKDFPFVIYENLCPVCGKGISIEEIINKRCNIKNIDFDKIGSHIDNEYKEFETYFKDKTGKTLRAIQVLWSKRVLGNKSFSIESPTGTGKTLFGISMAAFFSKKNKKSYIIVPTTSLLEQVVLRFNQYFNDVKILYYHKDMKKTEKEEFLNKLQNREYDVLITTAAFLSKSYSYLEGKVFDFVFVDDLDAVLKASRNVDRILKLIGFKEEEIRKRKVLYDNKKGILVISTATTKQGRASLLFRSLLGFDVSQSYHTVRNVDDYYFYDGNLEKRILEDVKMLGKGGLIFTQTEEQAQELWEKFINADIKAGLVVGNKESDLEKFINDELDILIGIGVSYGKLVRGLDLPKKIRYALFYRVPGFKIYLKDIENLSDRVVVMLINSFREHPLIKDRYYSIINDITKSKELLEEIFKNKEFSYARQGIVIKEDHIFFPDIRTYIQASGRTSRMYSAGITKGLSIVYDEKEYIDALVYRAYWYDIEFKERSLDAIEKTLEEVDRTREEIDKVRESEEIIQPVLFIVESPTKAKQISRFYGKPAVNVYGNQVFYEISTGKYLLIITASLGHVVDLISKEYLYGVEVIQDSKLVIPHYGTIKKCKDCMQQYVDIKPKNCLCRNVSDSKDIIFNIYSLSSDVSAVVLATDPDNEGEKISWDIGNFSSLRSNIYRAEFHEVTKKAIDEALENLKDINENLVKSQIVRRVEDRWIGYKLSSILQKTFNNKNLSAGRVQTPVLGWVIDRFYKNKEKTEVYYVNINDKIIELGEKINDLKDKINGDVEVVIKFLSSEEREKRPLPPYTTDEVLRDINRLLKIPSNEGMRILQTLFENGLITYHRTDSTRVSEKGMVIARTYLGNDFHPRSWEMTEGAHECIRPTRPVSRADLIAMIKENTLTLSDSLRREHLAVYDLIFRRFMASQAKPYKERVVNVEIDIGGVKIEKEIVVRYEGKAYELYPYVGRAIELEEGKYRGKIFIRKISKYPLYTESDIIGLMKEKGIGRPSTYATILQKLYKRGYIVRKNNRVVPTKRGIEVYTFLVENYEKFVSEETTREMEEIMDKIEKGEENYLNVLFDLYKEIDKIK